MGREKLLKLIRSNPAEVGSSLARSFPKKKAQPPSKAPRDTSIFGGESHLKRERFKHRLRGDEFFKSTGGMRKDERDSLWQELSRSGMRPGANFVKPEDLSGMKKQLALGKWGKYRDMPREKRRKAEKFLRGVSGK